MKHKFWKWVTNAAPDAFGSERTLYLDGQISDETWWGDEVTPKAFKEELNAGSGDITLWINSPGGDCFAAAQIYNMLMEYPGNVTVKIDGLAASAASVIAMAGTKVCMSPVAMLMIHNPATLAYGDQSEMEKTIGMLSEVKESIINAYEIKSGLARTKISHMMDDETWLNDNGEQPEAMIYTPVTVTNSLVQKLKPHEPIHKVPAASLEKRLALLIH